MFKRILVPLDGSERAERALPIAARLGRASHGTLIVVQVLDIDMTLYIAPEMMASESVVRAESSVVGEYLTQVTTPFQQEGIIIEQGVLLGIPASMLLSAITSYHADLVVMCSHGRTGFMHWALGSVAEKIARISPVPTLILREHGSIPALTDDSAGSAHTLRVLVPLDGTAASKTAITPAATLITALAAPATAVMHLTRVVQPATSDVPIRYQRSLDDLLQKTQHGLQKTLENIRDGFEAPSVASLGLAMSSSVVVNEDIAQTIIKVAEHGEQGVADSCDIIAMATHGRTGLDHLALGSITERVIYATRLPVLVVPMPSKVAPEAAETQQHKHSAALPH